MFTKHKTKQLPPNQVTAISTKSMAFKIDKHNKTYALKGEFATQSDANRLTDLLKDLTLTKEISLDSNITKDNPLLDLTQKVLDFFKTNYPNGSITYNEKLLTVEGSVDNESLKNGLERLLKSGSVNYQNLTKVIPTGPTPQELELIAQEKAETEARELYEAQEALKAQEEKTQKAKIIEAEIQEVIDFENINFELNQATLTAQSIETLKKISTILKAHPKVMIEIGGHTDNTGDTKHNLTLSQNRVDTVKNALIKMHINQNRIKAIGYGETKALVSNDTEENRRINRRVEFKVIGD